jgi:DNA-binding response OmpR family regulator
VAVDAADGDLAAEKTIGNLGYQTAAIVIVAENAEERDRLVRELARRCDTVLLGTPRTEAPSVDQGGLRIDRDGHRVTVNGEEVWLTKMEFKLLVALVDRQGRVLDRETLLSDVWGVSAQNKTRTVDTHIQRLREKLRAAGGLIEGVRGVGYRFSERPQPSAIRRSAQGSAAEQ